MRFALMILRPGRLRIRTRRANFRLPVERQQQLLERVPLRIAALLDAAQSMLDQHDSVLNVREQLPLMLELPPDTLKLRADFGKKKYLYTRDEPPQRPLHKRAIDRPDKK